jgi:hypothetical protein
MSTLRTTLIIFLIIALVIAAAQGLYFAGLASGLLNWLGWR